MKFTAHIAGATVSAVGLIQVSKEVGICIAPLAFTAGAVIGALLPDIDTPKSFIGNKVKMVSAILETTVGHRTFFHSLLFTAIVGFVFSIINITFGIGIITGMLSHILLDLFDLHGVAFLYPFKKNRIRLFK